METLCFERDGIVIGVDFDPSGVGIIWHMCGVQCCVVLGSFSMRDDAEVISGQIVRAFEEVAGAALQLGRSTGRLK